jgi:hypothetical protein
MRLDKDFPWPWRWNLAFFYGKSRASDVSLAVDEHGRPMKDDGPHRVVSLTRARTGGVTILGQE